ncbi:MAG: DUF4830 domain-containing protein [Prevotella sp.]|nr:DUF4830 domain-containing protein [Prevotella sp.]
MSKGSSKKGIKIFLFIILAAAAAAALFFFSKAKEDTEADKMFTMASNAERIEFLNSQGWIVKPEPISKEEVTLPSADDEVYAEYAALQKRQGFDPEKYQGKPVTVVTYQVLNYPDHPENVTATMLLYNDRLIGGDVSLAGGSSGEEGFIEPLISSAVQTYLFAEAE